MEKKKFINLKGHKNLEEWREASPPPQPQSQNTKKTEKKKKRKEKKEATNQKVTPSISFNR